jgi:hypothetical protein
MKESGTAIDRSSSDRERIQSRAKPSENSKIDRCHGVENMGGRTWVKISEVTSGEWSVERRRKAGSHGPGRFAHL